MEVVKGRSIEIGQRVRVYVNLHKQGRFSIVDMKSGLVCCYVSNCLLENAIFHVSETGKDQVRKTKRKLVHAWVRGTYLGGDINRPQRLTKEIQYNPYYHDGFTDTKGHIIKEAAQAYFENKKVFIQV